MTSTLAHVSPARWTKAVVHPAARRRPGDAPGDVQRGGTLRATRIPIEDAHV